MPLKMRGNHAMRTYHWPMWAHTCSRASEPAANRLKYSERRNGLCARSSAVSASNHSSFVMSARLYARLRYTLDDEGHQRQHVVHGPPCRLLHGGPERREVVTLEDE